MVAYAPIVTIHVPNKGRATLLTKELIVETGRVVARDLRLRFGINDPQIAVAGLNPHAGEGGAIGREDLEIVAPAVVAELQFEGLSVEGPLPADTLFFFDSGMMRSLPCITIKR